MSDAFISYSSKDRASADDLAKTIEKWGHRVFYDQKLKAGEEWPSRLEEEIRRAQFVLILLSPDYLNSPWANRELERSALLESAGKTRIIPVLIRPTKIPHFLHGRYYADFSENPEAALAKIREAMAEPRPSAARRAARFYDFYTIIGLLSTLTASAISVLAWLLPFGGKPALGFTGTAFTVIASVIGLTALVALIVAYRSSRQPPPVKRFSREVEQVYIDSLNRSELNPLRIGELND